MTNSPPEPRSDGYDAALAPVARASLPVDPGYCTSGLDPAPPPRARAADAMSAADASALVAAIDAAAASSSAPRLRLGGGAYAPYLGPAAGGALRFGYVVPASRAGGRDSPLVAASAAAGVRDF